MIDKLLAVVAIQNKIHSNRCGGTYTARTLSLHIKAETRKMIASKWFKIPVRHSTDVFVFLPVRLHLDAKSQFSAVYIRGSDERKRKIRKPDIKRNQP